MKILQITSTFFPVLGGQEKVVYEISKRLAEKGHEVTILTTDLFAEKEKYTKEETLDKIKILRFKNKYFLGGYGYSPDAINWLKKNWKKYDIVHSHGYNRYLSEIALKVLYKKIPLIFSPHGFIHTKKNYLFKIIHDLTIGRYIRKANYCTALTKLDFKEYKRLGVKERKILEIPNGVDFEEFSKEDKKEISKIKKEYGKFILYVGRIHKSKGLQYVIEAIKDIDIKLLIVGKDSGYKKELEKISEGMKIRSKIVFLGGIIDKKLIDFYKASEAFVLFSEWEGFGIVAIEAMAAGKPLIVSDRGSLPYLVKEGKQGFVVEFKNVQKLSNKIEEILTNKKLQEKMGKEGIKTSKNYDWKKIVNKYEEVYKNAKNNS
jgi:glycosyltransferase involved in cell wall biosynthesis